MSSEKESLVDQVARLDSENAHLKQMLHYFEENRTRIYFYPSDWDYRLVPELAKTVERIHGRGVVLIPKVGIKDPEVYIARDITRTEIVEHMAHLVEVQKGLFQKAYAQVQQRMAKPVASPVATGFARPPLSHNQLVKATKKMNDFARRIA